MKTLTVFGFLLLASQASAQTLPMYADVPKENCLAAAVKEKQSMPEAWCAFQDAANKKARRDLEKRWNSIDSRIRLQCVTNKHAVDYQTLSACVASLEGQGGISKPSPKGF
jgi:hypothetical protein